MSSDNSLASEATKPQTQIIYKCEDDISEDPPKSEWSSLLYEAPEENLKRINYSLGLYSPGSGEVCTKYATLSASSVLRHPYYNYPGVKDPGIEAALLKPEPLIIYPDDGQQLYLALCKEINLCPIRSFYRQLLTDKISLRYYGVHTEGFRPIALALEHNINVTVVDLTDNWINEDGCYHLGCMLAENTTIQEINLSGCRIGRTGAKRLLANLHTNKILRKLNLSENALGDEGVEVLAKSIFLGAHINNINLSNNNLTPTAVMVLNDAFETHNHFTHLDLSRNTIISGNVIYTLCQRLSENTSFEELNLSWTALSGQRVGNAIKILFKNPNVHHVYLNNNRLSSDAIKPIGNGLSKAKGLITLDLSFNPLTPEDAYKLLEFLKERDIKLRNLLLENVSVWQDFVNLRSEVLSLKFRKHAVITFGNIKTKFIPSAYDLRQIIFRRAETLCKKAKKHQVDIVLYILQLQKNNGNTMDAKQFQKSLRATPLDNELTEQIINMFAGPIVNKNKTIKLGDIVEYLKRLWPDRKLPPTPPPVIEPVIENSNPQTS